MSETPTSALVVFSGGQDSTTCLYWALKNFSSVSTITFDYGQRHRAEISAAKKIAGLAGVPWQRLALAGFSELGTNSLTGQSPVSAEINAETGLPNTFVPGRNLIFLTYAAAFAYSRNITNLVGGMCETDYSGYPDCRRNALNAQMKAINLGMEANIELHTPLMALTKADSVKMAVELDALGALAWSHTCYAGSYPPCGKCPACILRANGFSEAGVEDPLFSRPRGDAA